jgi:hypothetical protein
METSSLAARAADQTNAKAQKDRTTNPERFIAGKEYIGGASPLLRGRGRDAIIGVVEFK